MTGKVEELNLGTALDQQVVKIGLNPWTSSMASLEPLLRGHARPSRRVKKITLFSRLVSSSCLCECSHMSFFYKGIFQHEVSFSEWSFYLKKKGLQSRRTIRSSLSKALSRLTVSWLLEANESLLCDIAAFKTTSSSVLDSTSFSCDSSKHFWCSFVYINLLWRRETAETIKQQTVISRLIITRARSRGTQIKL